MAPSSPPKHKKIFLYQASLSIHIFLNQVFIDEIIFPCMEYLQCFFKKKLSLSRGLIDLKINQSNKKKKEEHDSINAHFMVSGSEFQ